MRIAVTGANGFIGQALARRLLNESGVGSGLPRLDLLTLIDRTTPSPTIYDPRVRWLEGDFAGEQFASQLFDGAFDCLFHLAALPGGAAEANPDAGWRTNLEAPIALFKALARSPAGTKKVVFASSVAVFGAGLPPIVDDDTYPTPTLSYGAQKLMLEIWLADASRRGVLDARSVRLPGIVARPEAPSGHISAFLSNVFHKVSRGEPFVAPMGPEATTWLLSRDKCIDNLLVAAGRPADSLPARRAWTMPALQLSMRELVEALAEVLGPDVGRLVTFAPDARVEAQFGAQPPLATRIADALGMKHDGDAVSLVRNVLNNLPPSPGDME
jgi:nucleoside-diphosphate-sugar epimerase